MLIEHYSEEVFESRNHDEKPFLAGTYDACIFRNCVFQKGDLSGFRFIDCRFENCDLSLATLHRTVFSQVHFSGCKLLGLSFPQAERLGMSVSFENCQLAHSSFEGLKLKKTSYFRCSLQQVDFSEADLVQSDFSGSDLTDAIFLKSNLEQADFREAVGFVIDPELNRVKKARFRTSMLEGLLRKYQLQLTRDE